MNSFPNPSVWFGCKKCTRVFPDQESFQKHVLDYHTKRQTDSFVLSFLNSSNSTTNLSTTKTTENENDGCPWDYTIKTNTKLDASNWRKYFSKQGTCSICLSLKKLSEAQMKSHFEMHLKSYHCKCCPFKTSSFDKMEDHTKNCQSLQQFPQQNLITSGTKHKTKNKETVEESSEQVLCSDIENGSSNSQAHGGSQTNTRKSNSRDILNSAKLNYKKRNRLLNNSRKEIAKCRICNMKLFKSILQKHIKTHAGKLSRINKCRFCKKRFLNASTLRSHEEGHRSVESRKCGICPYKCALKCRIGRHEKSHFNSMQYTCTIAYEEYKRNKKVDIHFQCNFCKESFMFAEIQEHVITKVCLKCTNKNCTKEFYTVADKMKHMDESIQLKCAFCNDIVDGECNLISHERNHLGNFKDVTSGTSETCTICSKTFKMRSKWIYHLRQHNLGIAKPGPRKGPSIVLNRNLPEERLTCTFCGKIFQAFNKLNQHMSRHLGEKMMKCENCSYKCVSKSDLTKHSNVHKKAKLYTCSFCSKSFSFQENKIRHEAAVHQTNNLKCPKCIKVFTHKTYLKDHLQSHLKNKSFKCKFCGKSYQNRPNMYRHIREQHKNEKQVKAVNEKFN
ncbi:unnamed protein product [Orchesella dallaii]|uniref:C2H2-type domain-containing protein n=1 Tax=Orchesella dallaii TaxID=48710 RepID=A0ABP1R8A9_9HEXA